MAKNLNQIRSDLVALRERLNKIDVRTLEDDDALTDEFAELKRRVDFLEKKILKRCA